MRRIALALFGTMLIVGVVAAPAAAKSFGQLYAEGQVYRTFGVSARVDPGTGTDPIFTFENSTNPDQLSVARYAPGAGSHGGRWAVHHATWTNAEDSDLLVTDYETLAAFVAQGRLSIVRDEAADFRCPIIPNG
jgi:hypothetical protein